MVINVENVESNDAPRLCDTIAHPSPNPEINPDKISNMPIAIAHDADLFIS